MPGYDGTGPRGQGPRTGGGFGYCPPWAGYVYGQHLYGYYPAWLQGRGRGRGRGGWRGHFYEMPPPPYYPFHEITVEDEIAYLEDLKAGLEEELNNIRGRLDELHQEQAGEKPEDQAGKKKKE